MEMSVLKQKYDDVRTLAGNTMVTLGELLKASGESEKNPMLQVYAYEASRRIEEFMHRVGDCMAVLSQKTDENVQKTVDDALASGKISVVK